MCTEGPRQSRSACGRDSAQTGGRPPPEATATRCAPVTLARVRPLRPRRAPLLLAASHEAACRCQRTEAGDEPPALRAPLLPSLRTPITGVPARRAGEGENEQRPAAKFAAKLTADNGLADPPDGPAESESGGTHLTPGAAHIDFYLGPQPCVWRLSLGSRCAVKEILERVYELLHPDEPHQIAALTE